MTVNTYKIVFRKPAEKRPLERPRSKWKDTNKVDVEEVRFVVVVWIHLAQDRIYCILILKTVMDLQFHNRS
jgi:hypothetical protein